MRTFSQKIAVVGLVLSFNTTNAHHSNAPHYDRDQPIMIEGIVTEFEFVNPHAFLHIQVTDGDGKSAVWSCEMLTANTLRRLGWTENTFTVGQEVSVMGIAARRDPLGCSFNSGVLADGTVINRGGGIADPFIDDLDQRFAILADGIPNLAGPWVRDRSRRQRGLGVGSRLPGAELLTAAGLEAQATYDDRFNDPSFECSAASITRAWSEPGTPTEIDQLEDRIIIRHEYMDTVREVYLAREHPEGLVPRRYGHSVGWYEDSTLVIDTIGFIPGVLTPHPGVLHSDVLHTVERLTLNREEKILELEWVAEDVKYFKSALTGASFYGPAPYGVDVYDCTPERANR